MDTAVTPQNQLPAGLDDTDLCVLCGMCLPHCPTYRIYQNEAESPRGRISLIQAYARGQLSSDPLLIEHLDHCLGCMACEAICPSRVPYGSLMASAQQQIQSQKPKNALLERLLKTTARPGGLNNYQPALQWYKKSGLNRLAQLSSALLPDSLNKARKLADSASGNKLLSRYETQHPLKGRVALFTGCMGTTFDYETLLASIKLLNHCGYTVLVPEQQYCCGALHQRHGQPDTANDLVSHNRQLFQSLDAETIIYTSSGCGGQLEASEFPTPTTDILSFLQQQPQLKREDFLPLQQTLVIHESCTRKNVLKRSGSSQSLLQLIPELEFLSIQHDAMCCGAGGSHQLLYPELAASILQFKLDDLKAAQPALLVSDNLSCSLHIRDGLQQQNIDITITHPVSLLASQLDNRD